MNGRNISRKMIERLLRYFQFLIERADAGAEYVFSRDIAQAVNISPEQVRRDLMSFKVSGTPQQGYSVKCLMGELRTHIQLDTVTKIALVGAGNLGKAILSYFSRRRPNIIISAVFDSDSEKTDRVYAGCRVFHTSQLREQAKKEKFEVGIITVPADNAQSVADELVEAGVGGIVNFAPIKLNLPENVFLEQIDITLSIEKTAYFAKRNKRG